MSFGSVERPTIRDLIAEDVGQVQDALADLDHLELEISGHSRAGEARDGSLVAR